MLGCAPPPGDLRITGVAALTEAGPSDISFLGSEAFLKEFNATAAGAVLVHKKIHLTETPRAIVLTVTDADLAMAKVLEAFAPSGSVRRQGRMRGRWSIRRQKLDPMFRLGRFA